MSILISLYAPIILNEAAYINVTEKTMNAQLPNHPDDSELFWVSSDLSSSCSLWNLLEMQQGWMWLLSWLIYYWEDNTKPRDSKFNNDEKQEVLTWRNTY